MTGIKKLSNIADSLWGEKARFSTLFIASLFLLFTFLGGREIWTQEHRWADIVSGMFFRHDFLHPYLGQVDYYDKPLLSYWLIAAFAKLNQALTSWTLRLPSAFAGLLTIWSIYCLGTTLKNKQLGLLSGWLLLTTFYFVFWARTSSADMLNVGGSLFAIAWYIEKRDQACFFNYFVFFLIVALTSLCKGLVGAIVPLIAVFIDMVLQKSWKQHLLQPALWLALLPALFVYFIPFFASSYFSTRAYSENGLYLVYRENILRYFQPFDHQGPIYTYLIYLPLYALPSAIFLIPALFSLKSRWKALSLNSKWIVWTFAALFLFFTLSGSRRSYYVLPIVPFAILFIADWILSPSVLPSSLKKTKRQTASALMIVLSFAVLYAGIDLLQQWYYSQYGAERFAVSLMQEAEKIQPWKQWNVVMLDGESKLNFYLQLSPYATQYQLSGAERSQTFSEKQLLAMWPALKHPAPNTIFVTRKRYASVLQPILAHYREFEIHYPAHDFLIRKNNDIPIAYIEQKGSLDL